MAALRAGSVGMPLQKPSPEACQQWSEHRMKGSGESQGSEAPGEGGGGRAGEGGAGGRAGL